MGSAARFPMPAFREVARSAGLGFAVGAILLGVGGGVMHAGGLFALIPLVSDAARGAAAAAASRHECSPFSRSGRFSS